MSDIDDRAIGGSDVCHTCAAHVKVITEDLEPRIAKLEAELTLLSAKACASVLIYRAALGKLTDSFKYSTEVVMIAKTALAAAETSDIDPTPEHLLKQGYRSGKAIDPSTPAKCEQCVYDVRNPEFCERCGMPRAEPARRIGDGHR